MSNEALAWAWKVPCPPTAKLVLVALADRANADGECFPSSRDIIERTGLAERTVRLALRELEAIGALRSEFRAGRSTIYVVSMAAQRGASDAGGHVMPGGTTCRGGGHVMPGRGASDAGEGGTTCPHNPHITLNEPTLNPQRDAPAFDEPLTLTPEPKAKREPGGHRLPADWHPSVTLEGFAVRLGLNADAVAAQFRDYWHAAPGAKGRKADWDATWRNWCRREAERAAPFKGRPVKTSQMTLDEQNDDLMRRMQAAMGQADTPQAALRLAQ